ncbi:MAG: hypothetical protein ABI488_07540 [Polyangiaceae bacterium]
MGQGRSRESAALEFTRAEQDTDGLSLFEVVTDEDRLVVVAAIACERGNSGRVDLIEVERDIVEGYGPVDQTPEKGTTPVPAANRLHRSLDWDPEALRRMADALFEAETEPRAFAPAAVRSAVRSLDATAVIGESAQAFVREEQAKPPPR